MLKLAALILSMVAVTACAGGTAVAESAVPAAHTLEGVLLLKGSEPRISVILQTDKSGSWQLAGVDKAELPRLQRRRVRVSGEILRAPPVKAPLLPLLRVDTLTALP